MKTIIVVYWRRFNIVNAATSVYERETWSGDDVASLGHGGVSVAEFFKANDLEFHGKVPEEAEWQKVANQLRVTVKFFGTARKDDAPEYLGALDPI